MSLDDIKNRFDTDTVITNKIKVALKDLGDHAEISDDFRRRAGLAMQQLTEYVEQFSEHVITVREGGRSRYLWAGTKQFADKAKRALGQTTTDD